jgi:Bacterial regulatory proteins, gntR family
VTRRGQARPSAEGRAYPVRHFARPLAGYLVEETEHGDELAVVAGDRHVEADDRRLGTLGAQAQVKQPMEDGAMLPSVRTLMQTYGVSDGTVKRALRELRDEGRIRTYQGRGSFKA